jgi:hypothetical protein
MVVAVKNIQHMEKTLLEMVLTYCGLRHLALCCLQTNVLPHWLVSSTLQCIPLHHKTSGFEGMVIDLLTVLISNMPPFHQH